MAIYVIEEEGSTDYVKIGFTERSPEDRLSELQTGNPRRLRVLAFKDGTESEEQRLHAQFACERVVGEWFRRSPRVEKWISEGMTKRLPKDPVKLAATNFKTCELHEDSAPRVDVSNSTHHFGKFLKP